MIVSELQGSNLANHGCSQISMYARGSRTWVGDVCFRRYDLAQHRIFVDRTFGLLDPFGVPGVTTAPGQGPDLPVAGLMSGHAVRRHALGYLGGRYRAVDVGLSGRLHTVEIEGVGRFVADPLTSSVHWLDPQDHVALDELAQALLGPPFLLLAAGHGTWLLHASAVLHGDRLVAFIGKSGWGKSTLAAFLDAREGWQRVSDDMLPISQSDRGVDAWPRFPQYKLPPTRQPALGHPPRLSLDAVYLLMPADPRTASVDILSASSMEAATAIMGQTAGAKLFDSALLAQHFTFGAHVANTVRVRRLSYPRRFELLPAVADALAADLDDQCAMSHSVIQK